MPSCHYPALCQMSLIQTFDKNAKKIKVAFLSNLPFGTKLGGKAFVLRLRRIQPLNLGSNLSVNVQWSFYTCPQHRYRIDVQKNFQTEIKRIITEQLSGVTSKINDPEVEFDEKGHASRKHFKKIRAVWRLIRDDIGKKMYQSENVFYRDLGRKLAVMREVRVHLKTLKDMEEDHADEDSFNQIQAYLQKRYASEKERVKQEHILDQVTEQVELGKQRVIDLQLSNEIFNAFEKGIKRVYKKGTKALEAAKKDTSTENLHEWRKRVKYLWYHVRLL